MLFNARESFTIEEFFCRFAKTLWLKKKKKSAVLATIGLLFLRRKQVEKDKKPGYPEATKTVQTVNTLEGLQVQLRYQL